MRTFIVAALFITAGCHPMPPPDPVPPGPPPTPVIGASCAEYCAHAADLECPAAQPTPGGASCEAVCLNVQGSGVLLWDLECRAAAPSCEAIDRCDR
jgi:hypothetical protein